MYHVKARETTVTIGERVFSPVFATTFAEKLPDEVAERADLLQIEEVLDEQPLLALGSLSATGTLETAPDGGAAGGTDGDNEGATDGGSMEADPTLLTDKALTGGVTVLSVGEDDEGLGEEPDPFADPAEGPGMPAGDDAAAGDAPALQSTQVKGGRGRGGRR